MAASAARRGAWPLVMVAHAVILMCLAGAGVSHASSLLDVGDEAAIKAMSALLLAVCAWSLWSWRLLKGSIFDLYGLFVIAAALFNGGQAFLGLFDIYSLNTDDFLSLFTDLSPATTLNTVFLITLGMASLHAGALLGFLLVPSRGGAEAGAGSAAPPGAVRTVGWGFLAVSAVPVVIVLAQSIQAVIAYGYLGLFQSRTSFGSGVLILSSFVVPGLLFTLAGSKGLRLNVMFLSGLALTYCSALFFLGNRQGATMLLVAFAWIFHRSIRKIPKAMLLGVGALLLFVVFPAVTYFRLVRGSDRLSIGTFADIFSSIENPFVAVIYEMGGTSATVGYTLDLVPGARDFDMGVSYFYALFTVFPSLFWEDHPSTVHGALNEWLIYTVDPVTAQFLGNSFGYSFIAEAYMNFGWIGAPVALAVIGLLVGCLTLWADKPGDPAKIAVLGCTMAFFLIFARGESSEIFRPIAYYALIPYFSVLLLRAFMPQRSKTSAPPRKSRPESRAPKYPADDETLSSPR